MGRLIDADAFEKFIKEKYKDGESTDDIKDQMLFDLSYQPTAYDVEKVISTIDESMFEFNDGNNCATCVFKEVCDDGFEGCVETMMEVCRGIVKRGGVQNEHKRED